MAKLPATGEEAPKWRENLQANHTTGEDPITPFNSVKRFNTSSTILGNYPATHATFRRRTATGCDEFVLMPVCQNACRTRCILTHQWIGRTSPGPFRRSVANGCGASKLCSMSNGQKSMISPEWCGSAMQPQSRKCQASFCGHLHTWLIRLVGEADCLHLSASLPYPIESIHDVLWRCYGRILPHYCSIEESRDLRFSADDRLVILNSIDFLRFLVRTTIHAFCTSHCLPSPILANLPFPGFFISNHLSCSRRSHERMEQHRELDQLPAGSQILAGTYTELSGQGKHRKDAVTLARLGKKQVLKVCHFTPDTVLRRVEQTCYSADLAFYLSSGSAVQS